MADFFRGLAGGFQTGLQFGNAMQQREERERLREAMGLTPQEMQQRQASPEELGRAQAETQALAAEDARMFGLGPQEQAAYAPQMPVEGQRVGLPRYQLAGQTYDRAPTQQEIQQARYGAMADVIAERDPARAMEMRQRLEDQAYQARIRPIQEKQMINQGLLTEGQITEMNRNQARTKKLEAVDTEVAQWQSKRLLDPNTNEARPSTPDDDIAALQYRATALRKAGLAKEATESLKDYQGFAVNQIKLDETQRNSQLGAVAAALATGDLEPARAFYDRFVLDGAKVTAMKADPKTGAITVSRVRDDGTALPDRTIKGGANELLASLNSFRDPMSLYTFSQNEFNNNLKTKELGIRQESLQLQKNSQALAEDTAAFNKMQGIADSARKDIVLNRPVVTGIKTFKNSAGEAVLVDTSKLEQNPDGTLKLPKGLTPATTRTEPTDAAVAKLAADIMKDRKQWSMKDGKPVAPSPEQAGAMARAVLRKNAAVVDENESPEDKLIRLMQASQQAQ